MKWTWIMTALTLVWGCTPDPSLKQMLDRQEAEDTVNRLFVQTDNRSWEDVKALFAESVLFDMTSLSGGQPASLTPKEIVDAWARGLKDLQAIHHQSGNFLTTIKGDQADVFCYGTATHFLANPTNHNLRTFVGSYNVHLSRRNGYWLIDGFKFNSKYVDGNLNLEAANQK